MIVQLLSETPAVLSLGKLCKEHGYQWARGQEPRLTKNGKIFAKTDNFVTLVVPGRSSASGSSSSSTSRMQGTTPSESQDPDKTRSDSLASGNRDGTDSDKMERDDQSQAVPEWLQNFPENLEEPQIPVPAHTSQEDSDLERPTKLVEKSKFRKRRFYIHLPKAEIATCA